MKYAGDAYQKKKKTSNETYVLCYDNIFYIIINEQKLRE